MMKRRDILRDAALNACRRIVARTHAHPGTFGSLDPIKNVIREYTYDSSCNLRHVTDENIERCVQDLEMVT